MSKVLSPIKINVRSDPDRGLCFPAYDGRNGEEVAVWSEAQVQALLAEARLALRYLKDLRAITPVVQRALKRGIKAAVSDGEQ